MNKITLETTFGEVYNHPDLIGFSKYFYYGTDDSFRTYKIKDGCPLVWPNDKSVEVMNLFIYLNKKGLLSIIYPEEGNVSNIIMMKHPDTKKRKVAIITAGGGYSCVCNGVEAMPVCHYLYDKDYAVFLFTYNVQEKAIQGVADLANAISYLCAHQEELNIDMNGYMVGGFSAGGHLVSQFGTDNHGYKAFNLPKPGLLILGYPVISMLEHTHVGTMETLLGKNATLEKKKEYSTELHISKDYPKTFVWQCEHDDVVPFENTLLFTKALKENDVPFVFEHFDSVAHGWGIATNRLADGWVDRMLEFYEK